MYYILGMCFYRLLQIAGDTEDLESALKGERRMRDIGSGHCSALVKLLPGNSDLFASQVTWTSYGQMLRIQKKYSFGYHLTPGNFRCVRSVHELEQACFSSGSSVLLTIVEGLTILCMCNSTGQHVTKSEFRPGIWCSTVTMFVLQEAQN